MNESLHRRIARGLVTVVAVTLLAATAALLVARLLGYQAFVITTGSMAGTADPGSLIIAARVPTSDLQVDDILTYVPPADTGITRPVTHRLVEIDAGPEATVYRTKGDANAQADFWTFSLNPADDQTVMRIAIPYVGRPFLLLQDPGTRRLAIGVPALIIALLAANDFRRAFRLSPVPTH